MAAYMVIFAKVHDRAMFLEKYGKPAAEVVAKYGGKCVVRAPGAISLEGGLGHGQSIVVSEWQDKSAIERFWKSPVLVRGRTSISPKSPARHRSRLILKPWPIGFR